MKALFKKELWNNWRTPWGYLKAAGFLLLAGYFLSSFVESYNDRVAQYIGKQVLASGDGVSIREWVLQPYYESLVFFLLFFAPLSSMGMAADEFRSGTFFRLMHSPLSSTAIVAAKYLACLVELLAWTVVVSLPAASLAFFAGEGAAACLLGALVFFLAGAAFMAVGLAISALLRHSVAAAAFTTVLLFFLYFSHSFFAAEGSAFFRSLSPASQTAMILSGLVQPANVGYFIAASAAGLVVSWYLVRSEQQL